MSLRFPIGIGVLACLACVWGATMAAAGGATISPRRTVVFPVVPGAAGKPAQVECVVQCGPALPMAALALSSDGKLLAVGGYEEVLLWDLEEAKLAKRIGSGELHGQIQAVAFVDDGKALAVGDGVPHQCGAVRIFAVASGGLKATFSEPQHVVYCLALSPDGKLLAAGDADARVYVWDLAEGKLVKTLTSHNGWVLGVAFSGDGKRLATAGADQTVQIWDVGKWELVLRYDLPAVVHGVALSPDGNTMIGAVGGPEEWSLRIARIDTDVEQLSRRKPTARAQSTGTGMPLGVIWPRGGKHLFVPCADGSVRAHLAASGAAVGTFSGHSDWVYGVAATPDGSKLASGSADGTVKLWNLNTGKPLATLVQLAPGGDDWLIITPQGPFTASSTELIAWHSAGDAAASEALTARYHNPEAVRQALATKSTTVFAPPKKEPAKGKAAVVKPAAKPPATVPKKNTK